MKGFTLIELLAVIVILAIILIIAIPLISNVIENVKKSALESTTKLLLDASENNYAIDKMNSATEVVTYTFTDGVQTVLPGTAKLLEFSGDVPKNGKILVSNSGDTEIMLHDGKYCSQKAVNGEITVTEKPLAKCKLPSLILKPTAVITMTPNTDIDSATEVSFTYNNSIAYDGTTVVDAEWNNVLLTYPEGDNTVRLRVKDSDDVWSEWVEVTFNVKAPAFTPTTISAEKVLFTTDANSYFEFYTDSAGNINYFGYIDTTGTIFRKVVDEDGNEIVARQNLLTGVYTLDNNGFIKSFDVVNDEEDNFYIAHAATYSGSDKYKKIAKFNSSGTLVLNKVVFTDYAGKYAEGVAIDHHDNRLFFVYYDSYLSMIELDEDLNQLVAPKNIYVTATLRMEFDIKVTDTKIYVVSSRDGAYAGSYIDDFSIFNRNLVLTRTITVTTGSEYRYIGQIVTDSRDKIWLINNQKTSGTAPKIQLLNDTETAFSAGITILGAPLNTFMRASLLETGEMLIVYRNTSVRAKYLQK